MRETNERVFRCDHCNRAIVSKGAMTLHERVCKQNPNNWHKCFKYCKHLCKSVENVGGYYEEQPQVKFTCSAKNNLEMYSYKLERISRNKSRIENLTRMPLQCDLYEPQDTYTPDELCGINQ